MKQPHIYAWKPDIADHRDLEYVHLARLADITLPDHVDRLGLDNPIEDQGQLGSCTGNSSTSALEIVTHSPPLSRLFAYYNARAIEHSISQDAGAMIRNVIKAMSKQGVCLESLWPYIVQKFAKKPPIPCYKNGLLMVPKVARYERVTSLLGVKTALASGLPVVFGFSVPEYFESAEVARGALVRMPLPNDKMIGGHAVVAVGYDDREAVPFVWVRNSWGKAWGLQGYFKMDARWFDDPRRLVDDMWVIHPFTS